MSVITVQSDTSNSSQSEADRLLSRGLITKSEWAEMSGLTEAPAVPVLTDCVGIVLNVGDQVVEAVMTKYGPNCPKMSASPELYYISSIDLNQGIVLVRSQKGDITEKYYIFDMSELAWVG